MTLTQCAMVVTPARPSTARGGAGTSPYDYLASPKAISANQKLQTTPQTLLQKKLRGGLRDQDITNIRGGTCSKDALESFWCFGVGSDALGIPAKRRAILSKKVLNAVDATAAIGCVPVPYGVTPEDQAPLQAFDNRVLMCTKSPHAITVGPDGTSSWLVAPSTELEKQNRDLGRQLADKTELLRLECLLNDEAWTCVETLKRKAARPFWMEEKLHREMIVLSHPIHGLHRQMTETKYLRMGDLTVKTPLVECFVSPGLHTHKEPMFNEIDIDGVIDRDMVVQFVRKRIKDRTA